MGQSTRSTSKRTKRNWGKDLPTSEMDAVNVEITKFFIRCQGYVKVGKGYAKFSFNTNLDPPHGWELHTYSFPFP